MENLINLGIGFIQRPLNENQVRIHLEGTYTVAGRVYTPKRNITLNKEVVTLKELIIS